MELTVIVSDKYIVAAISNNGACETIDFLRDVEKTYKASADGLFDILNRVSANGLEPLPDSLSHLVDKKEKIYEFIKGNLRLFYFRGQNNLLVICTSVTIKKTQKVDKKQVDLAIRRKLEYLQSVKDGTIVLIEDN